MVRLRQFNVVLVLTVAVSMIMVSLNHGIASMSTTPYEICLDGDSSYVEILPPIDGIQSPRAIIVGSDQLLYVADYDSNQIVMLDANGTIVRRRTILHPISISQNSKFDLYIGGETLSRNQLDTTRFDTIGAIYKINLDHFDTTYVAGYDTTLDPLSGDTTIIPLLRDTSYYYDHDLESAHERVIWSEPRILHPRRYVGIGVFPNDDYLVARNGSNNSSFIDPDTRVLLFSNDDVFMTPLGDLVTRPSGGSAITDISILTNIAVIPGSKDFIITQKSLGGIPYGATWMDFYATPDFQGWIPRFDPARSGQDSVDLIRPNRFSNASAVTIDHRRREIFIVDTDQDSIVKFDWNGHFMVESFGKAHTRSDTLPGLSRPTGVAFSDDGTLYIADSGNRIIRRFRLSGITGVEEKSNLSPVFALKQNHPNPFNPSTTIQFSLLHSEFVTLKVFNILGELISTLVAETVPVGTHLVQWDAQGLPSGIYFYRLQATGFTQTRKFVLLR